MLFLLILAIILYFLIGEAFIAIGAGVGIAVGAFFVVMRLLGTDTVANPLTQFSQWLSGAPDYVTIIAIVILISLVIISFL